MKLMGYIVCYVLHNLITLRHDNIVKHSISGNKNLGI